MNRLLLTLSALLLMLSACNKATDSPVSAEEDLRSGTWRRTSGKVTYKDPLTHGDSTLVYDQMEDPCRLDNSLVFKVDFTGTLNYGDKHCTAGEGESKAFSWLVSDEGKRISLYNVADYFPTGNVDADIITRTLGYLTIRYDVVTVNPVFQTYDTLIYTDVLRRN